MVLKIEESKVLNHEEIYEIVCNAVKGKKNYADTVRAVISQTLYYLYNDQFTQKDFDLLAQDEFYFAYESFCDSLHQITKNFIFDCIDNMIKE